MSKKNKSMDVIKLRGALEYALGNAFTGEIIQRGKNENVVASVGRAWMLKRLGSNDSQVIDRIYLGTDNTAASSTQTGLIASAESRAAGTISTAGTTADPPYMTFAASWASNETFTNSDNIYEFGLFTDEPVMVGRYVTGSLINFSTSNTLAVTYTLSN